MYGKNVLSCMSYHVCLFIWIYRPTREFFTHMGMSPLPVKAGNIWPMLGTPGHWAVRVISCAFIIWSWMFICNIYLESSRLKSIYSLLWTFSWRNLSHARLSTFLNAIFNVQEPVIKGKTRLLTPLILTPSLFANILHNLGI